MIGFTLPNGRNTTKSDLLGIKVVLLYFFFSFVRTINGEMDLFSLVISRLSLPKASANDLQLDDDDGDVMEEWGGE